MQRRDINRIVMQLSDDFSSFLAKSKATFGTIIQNILPEDFSACLSDFRSLALPLFPENPTMSLVYSLVRDSLNSFEDPQDRVTVVAHNRVYPLAARPRDAER